MTTGSGKKTSKTGKAPTSRSRRKKVVEKAPVPVAIDKQKMAAFFSAAGLDSSVPDSVKESDEVAEAKEIALKESETLLPAEPVTATVTESGSVDEAEPVTAESEKDETVTVDEPADVVVADSENSNNKKDQTAVTATSPATGGGSDSFSILFMVFVLAVLALLWFYYISSAPLKNEVVARVEQGKVEIPAQMSKINGLEAEVTRLRAQLAVFEKAAKKRQDSTVKVSPPVKRGTLAGEKTAPGDAQASSVVTKKDPSFDKALLPRGVWPPYIIAVVLERVLCVG